MIGRNNAKNWYWLSLIVILLDQLTKYWANTALNYNDPVAIVPSLNMTLVYNTGAAFSFLSQAGGWQRWFFIALSSIVSVVIIVWIYQTPSTRRWIACTLALILGGAIGNLWDRIRYGYVIDFIDVYVQQWHWPAFNIADSAISIGIVMLIIDAFWFDQAMISTRKVGKSSGQ